MYRHYQQPSLWLKMTVLRFINSKWKTCNSQNYLLWMQYYLLIEKQVLVGKRHWLLFFIMRHNYGVLTYKTVWSGSPLSRQTTCIILFVHFLSLFLMLEFYNCFNRVCLVNFTLYPTLALVVGNSKCDESTRTAQLISLNEKPHGVPTSVRTDPSPVSRPSPSLALYLHQVFKISISLYAIDL